MGDSFRFPLDVLLGAEANVRLLRLLLHEVQAPLSVSDAAERTGLTRAGARKAFHRLASTGFVTRVGAGRSQQYAIQRTDPLLDALAGLFRAEYDRFERTLARIRDSVQEIPEIYAAWIRRTPEEAGQPLEIAVIARSDALSWLKGDLRGKLKGIEKDLDLIIEISAYSKADAPEINIDEVTLLAGVLEQQADTRVVSRVTGHDEREERALRLSRGVADLLRSDPSLVKRAIRHIDRLLREDQGAAAQDLMEWRQVLETYSSERLRDFMLSHSSRAARLRQSSPFFAVLTAEERDEVLKNLERAT